MKLLFIAALLGLAAFAQARCPNSCNGHGSCGRNDACSCYANWQGPDCSSRTCPFGRAWIDAPSDHGSAHAYAECSNRGVCDRGAGVCECFDTYEGSSCQRDVCPNECSGHGTCESIEDMHDPTTFGCSFNPDARNRQKPTNGSYPMYNAWDTGMIRGCKCDRGYSGADCSSRLCPKGDDPMTYGGDDEVQYVNVVDDGDGQFVLTYHDLYGGAWTTRPHTPTAFTGMSSDSDAQAAEAQRFKTLLTDLPNFVIEDLTVTVAALSGGVQYRVTFDSDHNSGDQKLLECHAESNDNAGAQPRSVGLSGTCKATEHLKGTKESAECSNRGLCQSGDAICECFEGYTDEHCAVQSALV
jgi:hypothetical protein